MFFDLAPGSGHAEIQPQIDATIRDLGMPWYRTISRASGGPMQYRMRWRCGCGVDYRDEPDPDFVRDRCADHRNGGS
jgi:hypothetical protein